MNMKVTASSKKSKQRAYVALKLYAETTEMETIKKDGEDVKVEVKITNAKGEALVETKGALDNFGMG